MLHFPVWMIRVSQVLNRSLRELDEWSVEDLLDQYEAHLWLHDVDNPPPPKPAGPGGMGKLASM